MAMIVVEVVSLQYSPVTTSKGTAVVDVVGPPMVRNAVVSPTPPPNPYENMIWIDVS